MTTYGESVLISCESCRMLTLTETFSSTKNECLSTSTAPGIYSGVRRITLYSAIFQQSWILNKSANTILYLFSPHFC